MITEAVGNWFLGITATVIGWIPPLSPDAVESFEGFDASLSGVAEHVAKLGPIIPFTEIGQAATILAIFLTIAVALQAARISVSFVTLGGGSV